MVEVTQADREAASWLPMETAPRDREILLLLGDTVPDHTYARVGSFMDAPEASCIGEADCDVWFIWDKNGESWWSIPLDEPFGWMPIPILPEHIAPIVRERLRIAAQAILDQSNGA